MFKDDDDEIYKYLYLLTNGTGEIYKPAIEILKEPQKDLILKDDIEDIPEIIKSHEMKNPKLWKTNDGYLGIKGLSNPFDNLKNHKEDCKNFNYKNLP